MVSLGADELVNSLRLRKNGRLFADDILKLFFFKENVNKSIQMSQKFVPGYVIDNKSALV